uniref:Uncharacterized protein n=1 Tax=Arundo donax TaxID=35708 RepID=A0A0A8Z1S4_ARUDO
MPMICHDQSYSVFINHTNPVN